MLKDLIYPLLIVPLYLAMHLLMAFVSFFLLQSAAGLSGPTVRFFQICVYGGFLTATVIPLLGCFLPDSDFKFSCMRIGNLWLGFAIYAGAIMLFGCLLLLILRLPKSRPAAILVLIFAVGVSLAVNIIGSRAATDLQVVHYEEKIDKKAPGLSSLRLVLLGDLHISVNSKPETIRRMTELVNEQEPDLILIGGDFFTSTYAGVAEPESYISALSGLKAPLGVYGVYGNHDVEEPLLGGFPMKPARQAFRSREMEKFCEKSGIRMLKDELVPLADGALTLAGRIDGEKAGDGSKDRLDAGSLLAGADLTKPLLVLEHEPAELSDLAEAGADFVMAGHTHNGQIFPGNLIIRAFHPIVWGLGHVEGVDTLVTSGVGFYGPPIRVGTISEISVVDLTFEN